MYGSVTFKTILSVVVPVPAAGSFTNEIEPALTKERVAASRLAGEDDGEALRDGVPLTVVVRELVGDVEGVRDVVGETVGDTEDVAPGDLV